MNKIIAITVLLSTIFIFSCNNTEKKNQDNNVVTLEEIYELEDELFNENTTAPNLEKTLKLGKLYVEYAAANQGDTIAPDFLYKAADIGMNVGKPKVAIVLFEKIISSYPNYRNIPTVMFLLGYVYENQLNDYEKAGQCYIDFLDKYPESDFADDATVSLKNLGKSPEEMIKEFENRN